MVVIYHHDAIVQRVTHTLQKAGISRFRLFFRPWHYNVTQEMRIEFIGTLGVLVALFHTILRSRPDATEIFGFFVIKNRLRKIKRTYFWEHRHAWVCVDSKCECSGVGSSCGYFRADIYLFSIGHSGTDRTKLIRAWPELRQPVAPLLGSKDDCIEKRGAQVPGSRKPRAFQVSHSETPRKQQQQQQQQQ